MTLTANDCPSCQQLQRELAAALLRAEQAERERDEPQAEFSERRNGWLKEIRMASEDLAAVRREREALREKMERINAAIHRGSLHDTKATVKRLDVPLVTLSPDDAQAILDAARAALEKTNG